MRRSSSIHRSCRRTSKRNSSRLAAIETVNVSLRKPPPSYPTQPLLYDSALASQAPAVCSQLRGFGAHEPETIHQS